MLQLLEFLPIIIFVLAYKQDGKTLELFGYSHTFDGIFSATAFLIAATAIQFVLACIIGRKLDKRALTMFAVALLFGGATLLLRNEAFILWKPTVFNWAIACILLISQLVFKRNLIHRFIGQQMQLPETISLRLSRVWIAYFFLVGALNLVVAYQFSEAFWVSYKLWSGILYTICLMIATVLIVAPHIKDTAEQPLSSDPKD